MVGSVARPLRLERPGGWYHVTARGNEGAPFFATTATGSIFAI